MYKSHITRHMRIHANEKPFNCKLCNYRSTRACHMIVHMRTHTGEKPYRCELCDYRSAQIAHKKIHTTEKTFKCQLCDYCTANKQSLIKHMRRHGGEKPYQCGLCNYCSALNVPWIYIREITMIRICSNVNHVIIVVNRNLTSTSIWGSAQMKNIFKWQFSDFCIAGNCVLIKHLRMHHMRKQRRKSL